MAETIALPMLYFSDYFLFFTYSFGDFTKKTGPVNGDECYFWRTTGCHFGRKCHYKHIPQHRGIDRTATMVPKPRS